MMLSKIPRPMTHHCIRVLHGIKKRQPTNVVLMKLDEFSRLLLKFMWICTGILKKSS